MRASSLVPGRRTSPNAASIATRHVRPLAWNTKRGKRKAGPRQGSRLFLSRRDEGRPSPCPITLANHDRPSTPFVCCMASLLAFVPARALASSANACGIMPSSCAVSNVESASAVVYCSERVLNISVAVYNTLCAQRHGAALQEMWEMASLPEGPLQCKHVLMAAISKHPLRRPA